ncbi:phosphopyruvate hydratase [Candidatus Parcubacteria bacterium]|nr:MAG: phosphopyruvate hydratase [Candidatus Parcubacteria bacterium]
MPKLKFLKAIEILDSRGNPTLQVTAELSDGSRATAAVPSGASTGSHEALELRDGGKRFLGRGVQQAVKNVNEKLAGRLLNKEIKDLKKTDKAMCELDGTANKAKLGANAILGVSLVLAKVLSVSEKKPLYQFLAEHYGFKPDFSKFPRPMFNVINGGLHADSGLSFQEFMLLPTQKDFPEAVRCGAEVFQNLLRLLKSRAASTLVGDEGGFAPKLRSNEEPMQLLAQAIVQAGYVLGKDMELGLDAASTQFLKPNGIYSLALEGKGLSAEQLVALYAEWHEKYHLHLVEDGLAEDDWGNWAMMTKTLGNLKMRVVGDDLFVTDVKRLKQGVEKKAANAILIKVNQIGTLSQTMAAIKYARQHKYQVVISHRSGETCDTTIADLAVAVNADYIKAGSLSRGERLAKYNRLLTIWSEENG